MKKYLSIFMLAFLVVVLSGCDLLGEDTLEKATEELCRENPESELCQADALTDLEESVILDLFNDMLATHTTMDTNDYCEQYISVSNIELLDACRTNISSLFPAGIENYEVDSVTIDGDEYIVEVSSKTDVEKLKFVFKTSLVEGSPVITEWSYSDVYVALVGVTRDEVLDLIDMFVLDMENEMLTDAEVCALYDGVDDDCDGIADARRKFKAGAALSKTVNILDPDDDGDGILVGEISFTLDGHVTVLKIAFDLDNTGTELKLMILDIDSDDDGFEDTYLTADEALVLFNEFVVDYLDPTVTIEELNMMYFDNEMDIDFETERMKDLEDGLVVNVLTTTSPLMNDEGFFVIHVNFVRNDETIHQEVYIKPIRLTLSYKINFGDGQNNEYEVFDLDEVTDFWNDFVEDYFDETVTFEELNMMYFNGMLETDFLDNRTLDLENGLVIMTVSVNYSHDMPDSYFDIELVITEDLEVYNQTLKIKVNRIDMALYMMFEDQDGMNQLPYEEALMILTEYKDHYNHMSMLSSTMCASTVVEYQVEECVTNRDMMISDGYMLNEIDLYMMDNDYMVDFIFEDADLNQIIESKIVYFNMNDDGIYLLEFYDDYMEEIDNDEIDLLLENFARDFGDHSVLTTNVCHFLTDPGEDNDCDGIVTTARDGGYVVSIGEVDDMGNEYIVQLIFMNDIETYSEYYVFSFYYDEEMLIKSTFNMIDTQFFMYTEIIMLFAELNDPTIPVSEVCASYVHVDAYARCEAIRNFHETNNYFMSIDDLMIDDLMNITVIAITYDSNGMVVEENTFVIYPMENAAGENPLFIESTTEGNNPLYE